MIRLPLSTIALLAFSALGASQASGQADMLPISRTAGALTVTLPKGKATLVALPNVKIVASGTVSAAAGSDLTLASSPTVLPSVASGHAIKIVSRNDQRAISSNAYGLSAVITAQAGQQVTAALAVAPNVGDEFVVYELSTIASLFGANNSAGLNAAATPDSADTLQLTNGGQLIGYFYNSAANAWRLVDEPDGANQGDIVIEPTGGVLVTRKDAGAASITLTLRGDALPARQSAVVGTGFSIINNPFLIPTTLAASLLHNYITGGTGPGTADVLYLEEDGSLTGYYFKTGGVGGAGWRVLGDNITNRGSVVLAPGKAILFKEQAGAAGFALPEPFAQ